MISQIYPTLSTVSFLDKTHLSVNKTFQNIKEFLFYQIFHTFIFYLFGLFYLLRCFSFLQCLKHLLSNCFTVNFFEAKLISFQILYYLNSFYLYLTSISSPYLNFAFPTFLPLNFLTFPHNSFITKTKPTLK